MNWIDIAIVVIILLYIFDGWDRGAIGLILDLTDFLITLWLAVRFHSPVGEFIGEKFGVDGLWHNFLGYVAVAMLAGVIFSELRRIAISKVPPKINESHVNRGIGVLILTTKGLAIAALVLVVLINLPITGTMKTDIKQSFIGGMLVKATQKYFGPVETEIVTVTRKIEEFLTVKPGSNETIPLQLPMECKYEIDYAMEREMLELVNSEREKAGFARLMWDEEIAVVARAHSQDMFDEMYFSHINPQGQDAGERMNRADIKYTVAGENIAYAPSLESAHTGLMNSEGHRRNILEPEFGRIGIGVINGGACQYMYTQNFAD